MYYCPNCDKDVAEPEWEAITRFRSIPLCPTCGEEIVESYDCPIHGTAAPDGLGNCAKCG